MEFICCKCAHPQHRVLLPLSTNLPSEGPFSCSLTNRELCPSPELEAMGDFYTRDIFAAPEPSRSRSSSVEWLQTNVKTFSPQGGPKSRTPQTRQRSHSQSRSQPQTRSQPPSHSRSRSRRSISPPPLSRQPTTRTGSVEREPALGDTPSRRSKGSTQNTPKEFRKQQALPSSRTVTSPKMASVSTPLSSHQFSGNRFKHQTPKKVDWTVEKLEESLRGFEKGIGRDHARLCRYVIEDATRRAPTRQHLSNTNHFAKMQPMIPVEGMKPGPDTMKIKVKVSRKALLCAD